MASMATQADETARLAATVGELAAVVEQAQAQAQEADERAAAADLEARARAKVWHIVVLAVTIAVITYDAFGVFWTIFSELVWKTPIL
jgi:hypothetical protein